jgi:putative membrane protein
VKNRTSMHYLGALTCVAALTLGGSLAAAQPPAPPPTTAQTAPRDPQNPPTPKEPMATVGKKAASAVSDASFVTQAGEAGMLEVEKGKIAVKQTSNPDVKEFAQKMISDHSKANDELESIARKKNFTLPSLGAKHQAILGKFEKSTGAAFDKAYVEDQIKDHEKAVALFEKEATSGTDAELKEFAQKTLPTLKEHQSMVKELKTKLTKGGTN